MDTQLKILSSLISSIKNHKDRLGEISIMIKDILNTYFNNKIICDKVFISNNYSDKTLPPINVIPVMPKVNIFDVTLINNYDLEINISTINCSEINYSDNEVLAFLFHELCENVITDSTLLRFKQNLIKFYDQNMITKVESIIRIIGKLTWIGVFSKTRKCYIDNGTNSENDFMRKFLIDKNLEYLNSSWDSALDKYIKANDMNNDIKTLEYLERKDKSEFMTFNELARKYTSQTTYYNNTDYSTFVRYLLAINQSELLKYYIEKEPDRLALFNEKDIFNIFNDNKILYKGNNDPTLSNRYSNDLIDKPTNIFIKKYSELEALVNGIMSDSEKINAAIEVKHYQISLARALNNDKYNKNILLEFRDKSNGLVKKLKNVNINSKISIIDSFI